MKVQEFITQYKLYGDDFIAKHLTNLYVSYARKIAEAHKIVDLTMYKEVNGVRHFWHDTPTQYNLFIQRLIANYTDIEMDNPLEDYDSLDALGLIEKIIAIIPQSEYSEFNTVLKMVVDDEINNIRSIPSYIDTKIDAIMLLLSGIAENEDIQKAISENVIKFPNQEG